MRKNTKDFYLLLIQTGLGLITLIASLIYFKDLNEVIFISIIALDVLLLVPFYWGFIRKHEPMYRMSFIMYVVYIIIIGGYIAFLQIPALNSLNSVGELAHLIDGTGIWGRIIFILVQFIQVTFIPLPFVVTTAAGVAVFGPFEAALLSLVGVISASLFAFFVMGRMLGKKAVEWATSPEDVKKYSDVINKKGKVLLPMMFLFPFFPDDILCMVAGLSSMSGWYYTAVIILVRPIGIFFTAYMSSGQIIPYNGWGLLVWISLFLIAIPITVWSFKNEDKIETFTQKIADKFRKEKKTKSAKIEK